jgi:hypothetical protein
MQKPRRQRKQTRAGNGNSTAAGPVYPAGNGGAELKSRFTSFSNYQLYHNVGSAINNTPNLLNDIALGTGPNQRIGNRIFLKNLRVNMVLNNKTDRPNVSYRVVVTAAPASAQTDSFGELFFSAGYTAQHYPTNSLLLYDQSFPWNQGSNMNQNSIPDKERSFVHCLQVPINKPIVYSTVNGEASTSLSVWVITFDAHATLQTDNIASIAQCVYALDYTDA